MLALLTDPQAWIAFLTLTTLELILGIDNIIFIAILVSKLPQEQREIARRIGLFFAMFLRIALLLVLTWIIGLTKPWFTLFGESISGRDLILISGGLFLLWKSTHEIHQTFDNHHHTHKHRASHRRFAAVILQIILIDLVFSLDSIITAIGIVEQVEIMIAAIVVTVSLMILYAGIISRFVAAHPTIKMLALAFLVVIGVILIADGLDHHIPRGYIYFALAFSVGVEILNIRLRLSMHNTHPASPNKKSDAGKSGKL